MNIMAPVNSFQSAKLQINAGADEIYVGLHDNYFKLLSFTGRGKYSNTGIKVHPDEIELENIIKLAHEKGVTVNYTANIPIMADSENDIFQKKYYEYVQKGIEIGVDTIIVGDLGNILFLKEMAVDKPIISSTFFSSFNVEIVRFLKELGVQRVILPHQVTLNEMREIKEKVNIELEIFVSLGCSNIDGSCHLMHNSGEDIPFGLPCKSKYFIKTPQGNKEVGAFLDATLDCAICSLKDIYEIGVDAIKIVGRDLNPIFIATLTKIHKDCIKIIENQNKSEKKYLEQYLNQVSWWKYEFCQNKRCKYTSENDIIKSFI